MNGFIVLDRAKFGDTPTRRCLVCQCKENPNSVVVYEGAAWLCDKCRAALLNVVERSNENAE